jgi:HlyD family secretion protein
MKKRWIPILTVALLVTALAIWKVYSPQAVVQVIQPRLDSIRVYVEEQAVTELPHDYLIAMPISGWLERIDLREGDAIRKGQVVARLDTDDLADRVRQVEQRIAGLETKIRETADNRLENNTLIQANAMVKAVNETVQAAEAKLQASKAIVEFAESEIQRLNQVRQADAAADREIRATEAEHRKAKAEYQSNALELAALKTLAAVSYIGPKFIIDYIDRKSFTRESYEKQLAEARTELEMAKRNLARASIESPIDGVVLTRMETRRQFLSAGTPLLTVGRLDDIEVTAEILTERATHITPGNKVDIFGEGIPQGPIPGSVLRVYPAGFKKISSLGVEQQRVKVAVKLNERPERLGVAYRVHVRIYYDQADNALLLPRTALFRNDAGRWQVMIVAGGKTVLRPLRVGLMNDDLAQVIEGITVQDQVVAQPSREIGENLRVTPVSRDWEPKVPPADSR